MAHESFPVGAIITKGLGAPACNGLITTRFDLLVFSAHIATPADHGGSHPMLPGEIQNFYKEVPAEQQPYLIPRDQNFDLTPKRHVVLTVKFGEKTLEKEFLVSDKRARMIVKILNFANTTKERVNVTLSGFKKVVKSTLIKVKNLRKRP